MADVRRRLSRFQVRCEGLPAWVDDTRHRRYYFDGLRFWRLGSRSSRLTTSWRVPAHGWVHEERCDCDLCRRAPGEGLPQAA